MITPIPSTLTATSTGAFRCVAKEVTVLNTEGIHMRPAAELLRLARQFKSALRLRVEGRSYQATGIIDILSANLRYGTKLTLIAEGEDAEESARALARFFERLATAPRESAALEFEGESAA